MSQTFFGGSGKHFFSRVYVVLNIIKKTFLLTHSMIQDTNILFSLLLRKLKGGNS
jgi:hypothetical protein